MSTTAPSPADPHADDLLRDSIRDLLPQLRMNELFSSCIRPIEIMLRCGAGDTPSSPHEVWARVREQYPRGAAFPLGSASERATRRCVLDLGQHISEVSPESLIHHYVSLLLFEAAMMNIRSSSQLLSLDFGFWYHWKADGCFRSAQEESELRARLWGAAQRRAQTLLTEWSARSPEESCPTDDDVNSALRETFDLGPMPRRDRQRHREPNVAGLRDVEMENPPLEIVLHGDDANVRRRDEDIVAASGGQLDDRVLDLLDIATILYFADIYVPRQTLFARDLCILAPVRAGVWEEHRQLLDRIASFLTGNSVSFRFVRRPGGSGTRTLKTSDDDRCVALFSGGLDSFAGAASTLAAKRAPVFVSHHASPMLRGMQRKLLEQLGGRLELVQVRTEALSGLPDELTMPDAPPKQALYQRSRSFLFLSIATAVALGKGIARVQIPENGIVALNVMFSEGRFNTRTAHPLFLLWFEQLVREVFQTELRIENPFALLTKGEVVSRIDEQHQPAIAATNSCWRYARVRTLPGHVGVKNFEGWHCGYCVPCFWRRASVAHARVATHDDEYLWDYVPDARWSDYLGRKDLTVLLDLYRSCRGIASAADDRELLELLPDLDEVAPGTLSERANMHRRYANEMLRWFDTATPRMFYRIAEA